MTSTNQSPIQHLDELCVIHADFDIWSGQTRLAASDLKLGEGGEIPPEKLALLGSKKICDPAKLKGFHRLKTKARRTLEHYGLPFMNGWAVPAERLDTILKRLDEIGQEFDAVRQEFLRSYDQAVDEWCADNPGYEAIIRDGAMPREVVEERIGFDYQVFMIKPVGEADDSTQQRLGRKVKGLSNDLFNEITTEANKFYEEKLKGRSQVGRTTSITLKNLRDKVDGLSFLNSAFDPLVRLLDETLRGYEQHAEGRNIVAPFLYQVVAVVLIMSDRSKIEGYANGSVTVDGMPVADAEADSAEDLPPSSSPDVTDSEVEKGDDAGTDADASAPLQEEQEVVPTAEPAVQDGPHDPPAEDVQEPHDPTPERPQDSSPEDLLADMDRFFENFDDGASQEASSETSSTAPVPAPEAPAPSRPTTEPAPQPARQEAPDPVPFDTEDDDWGSW